VARWREPDEGPAVPAWIRHADDGGFQLADWIEAEDFSAAPWVAESAARSRWIRARCEWLNEHPDVADVLVEQLRSWCEDGGDEAGHAARPHPGEDRTSGS
jgi:hypothetical protein